MGSFLSQFGSQFPTLNHFVAAIFAPTPFPSLAPTSFPSPVPVYPPYYEPSLAPSPIPTTLQEFDEKAPRYNETDVPSLFPTDLIDYDLDPSNGNASTFNVGDLPSVFPTMTPSTVPSSSPSSLSSMVPTSSDTYDPSDVGFRVIVDSGCSSEEGTAIQTFLLDQVTSKGKLRKRKLWSFLYGKCSWMCASWPLGRCYMLHISCSFHINRRDRKNRRLQSGSSGSPTDEQLTREDDPEPELSAHFLPQAECHKFNAKMKLMLSSARGALTLSDQCSDVLKSAHIDCFEPTKS